MLWEVMHCDRLLAIDLIREGLVAQCQLEDSKLAVVERLDKADSTAAIVAVMRSGKGDFPFTLDIIVNDASLEPRLTRGELHSLCKRWHCEALVNHDSADPFQWDLLGRGGSIEIVHVDAEALNNNETFVISHSDSPPSEVAVPEPPHSERLPTAPPPGALRSDFEELLKEQNRLVEEGFDVASVEAAAPSQRRALDALQQLTERWLRSIPSKTSIEQLTTLAQEVDALWPGGDPYVKSVVKFALRVASPPKFG